MNPMIVEKKHTAQNPVCLPACLTQHPTLSRPNNTSICPIGFFSLRRVKKNTPMISWSHDDCFIVVAKSPLLMNRYDRTPGSPSTDEMYVGTECKKQPAKRHS